MCERCCVHTLLISQSFVANLFVKPIAIVVFSQEWCIHDLLASDETASSGDETLMIKLCYWKEGGGTPETCTCTYMFYIAPPSPLIHTVPLFVRVIEIFFYGIFLHHLDSLVETYE